MHVQACSRLGKTGFNAYSINLDYRTGTHTDGKNWPGTMSALVILETGPAFCGGFYMLPQFHVAIAVRQGTVLFHRSGDADVGCVHRAFAQQQGMACVCGRQPS